MFVKKFEAPTIDEALASVKRDLGPDALILSTQHRKKGWFGRAMVQVTAAHQERSEAESDAPISAEELAEIFPHRRQERYLEAEGSSVRHREQARYVDLLPPPAAGAISKPFLGYFEEMGFSAQSAKDLNNRLVTDYRRADLNNRAFREKVFRRILSEGLRSLRPEVLDTRPKWLLVGVSGSGKTAAAVKLALYCKKQGKGASLASLDRRKLLGVRELATYARLVKTPFELDPNRKRPGAGTQFIDTPCLTGMSSAESTCEKLGPCGVILVLDATTRLAEMRHVMSLASEWNPTGVVFTRFDLCRQRGPMLELVRNEGLPLFGASMSSSFEMPFRFFQSSEFSGLVLNSGRQS